jgi:glycosyltransferase involved in cell wall biosynthesis
LAARLQLRDRIVFAGRVDHDDAARYLNAADLYVLPTLRYEGLPFSLLEAMACGLPVIASAIGGIPSVVRHGSNGWLIPPDDQRELSAAMDRLLTDRRLAETLAEAAHATVTKGFSADTMVDGTIGVCAAARESRG